MSPDQYSKPPRQTSHEKADKRFKASYPLLYEFQREAGDRPFRGLVVFLSDQGGLVGGLKSWDDHAAPVVMWRSGPSLNSVLLNLDAALASPRWKPDKFART